MSIAFKKYAYQLGLVLAGVVLAIGLSYAHAQTPPATSPVWTPPTALPPNGNVETPINVGSIRQVKTGPLEVGGALINGSLAILGGSPGEGKLLISDEVGLARWESPDKINECTGEGMVWRVNNNHIDDNGSTGGSFDDHLEVYCRKNIARFCLSGEACPWRTAIGSADNLVCSTALAGAAGAAPRNGWPGVGGMKPMASFKTSEEESWVYGWKGYSAYFCSTDGTQKNAYRMIGNSATIYYQ